MMNGSKKLRIVGWVLTLMVAALLIFASAMAKFTEWEGKAEAFATLGWTVDVMFKVGIVEAAIAILFLVPRAAFIAAILITGYLGGAVATHVRVGEPFFVPIIIGIVVWVALGLRNPDVFQLAFGLKRSTQS